MFFFTLYHTVNINRIFLHNHILGRRQVIHRYQGIYALYCFLRDIDPFTATRLHCRWERAASRLGITLVNLARNEWTPEKETGAEQLNVISTVIPTLTAVGLRLKEQLDKDWADLSSFILIQFMEIWSWIQVIWPIFHSNVSQLIYCDLLEPP